MNSILAFCPTYNTPGKHDATGAFHPEAAAFIAQHRAAFVMIDNRATAAKMREGVLHPIREICPEVTAFFCHGWRTGIQFGFGVKQIADLATAISQSGAVRGPRVVLYACSTGSPSDAGGDGGFADLLRDALCKAGAVDCQVDAHTTAGHCTRNPHVRRFLGAGSAVGGRGGQYIVTPGSALWNAWLEALKTDLRFRFPFMTTSEIQAELSGIV